MDLPDLAASARRGTFVFVLCRTRSKCRAMTMLKQHPALPSLGPRQRIKNTLLVLLTLFKFPASKRPNPCGRLADPFLLDAFKLFKWLPHSKWTVTALWKSTIRGLDMRWQYLLSQFPWWDLCGLLSSYCYELQSPVLQSPVSVVVRSAELSGTCNKYLRLVMCLRRGGGGVGNQKQNTTLLAFLLVVLRKNVGIRRWVCSQQRGRGQQYEQPPIRQLVWAGLVSMKPVHWLRTSKCWLGHNTDWIKINLSKAWQN